MCDDGNGGAIIAEHCGGDIPGEVDMGHVQQHHMVVLVMVTSCYGDGIDNIVVLTSMEEPVMVSLAATLATLLPAGITVLLLVDPRGADRTALSLDQELNLLVHGFSSELGTV